MAKEYIERAEAKEELLSWARCIKHPEHLLTEDAMCVLDSMKAADVVEVKHGRWLKTEEPLGWHEVDCIECSACHDSWIADEDYGLDFADFWKYCPNCGARMGDS